MVTRVCEWCGKEFTAKTNRARFCSSSCKYKHYYHTHPEYKHEQIDNSLKRLAADPEARAVVLAAGTRWRENHREEARAATKRWEGNNKEHCAHKHREWWDAHPGKMAEYSRAWRKNNPEKSRAFDKAKTAMRRAAKRGTGGSYTAEDFRLLCEANEWRCAYCGCELTPETVTADHIIPLSRGGTSDISNMVPCCRSCNSHKHNKTPEEYNKWLSLREAVISY